MSFQVAVSEIKPRLNAEPNTCQTTSEQIYEQIVETLDMPKLIAAVNYKKRERRSRTVTSASASQQRP